MLRGTITPSGADRVGAGLAYRSCFSPELSTKPASTLETSTFSPELSTKPAPTLETST